MRKMGVYKIQQFFLERNFGGFTRNCLTPSGILIPGVSSACKIVISV